MSKQCNVISPNLEILDVLGVSKVSAYFYIGGFNTFKTKAKQCFSLLQSVLLRCIFILSPCLFYFFFTVVDVHFSFSLGHSKGVHKVIGTWNTEETLACTRGGGGGGGVGYRGVWTSVDATAFVSKKRFLGNNILCCECTTNNQTSLVFLCIMYSIYRFVFIYIYICIFIYLYWKKK